MKAIACLISVAFLWVAAVPAAAQDLPVIDIRDTASGTTLQVDGEPFMVLGMNWGYMPIGENYLYSLWAQPEDVIKDALDRDMGLLKTMGVNTIRQYVGIPPKWVRYIYETHGIFTVLNHPMARYGFTLNGVWIPAVDYSDPELRAAVREEIAATAREFKDTPGVLMWLLGNENNYGLSWKSFEIEALPEGERDAARARYLYSLFNEVAQAVKAADPGRPVAMANGDVQYIDIIAEECDAVDVFGTNVYRGISARDLFQVVKDKLGRPVMFTEFGADAFNAKEMREDQVTQAKYLIGQWQEIYEMAAGKGRVGNAIGGLVFQWSDGWWKFGQDSRLDQHDTNASWPNAGYPEDFVEGENNMNEEWWGITAKGPPDNRGLYQVYPRAAYFALREAWMLDPYAPGTDLETIREHFDALDPVYFGLIAGGGDGGDASATDAVQVTGLRLELETISTGGEHVTTPESETPAETFPSYRGFDHKETFFADFTVNPSPAVQGNLSLNVLGHVPVNPINEIFYENRGRQQTVSVEGGSTTLEGLERVKVYGASVRWEDKHFILDGFYRTGHTHWGYEGDFFGLYPDAYYGDNLDIYNADAPVGFEMTGRQSLEGLKFAMGPQLWWGANPAILAKYRRGFGAVTATAMFQEDLAQQSTVRSSAVVPYQPTRKATLKLERELAGLFVEVGGIWSGATKLGDDFIIADEMPGGYRILEDEVRAEDTWGGKVKLTKQSGRWNWYAQGAYQGAVADGGPDHTITYTGWQLKESGLGNNANFLTGLAVNTGNFQIAPNFLWQKPIIGPIPADAPDPSYPRNILDDPFAVRGNRETVAGELMLTYDPRPATWLWAWDNDVRENAPLAWSLGVVFRHHPTTMDAGVAILEGGVLAELGGAPPAEDLWEVNARVLSSGEDARLVAHAYAGTGQPTAPEPRLIHRYGADARVTWSTWAVEGHVKVNDWGPYDYHRDFNLTFPVQLMADVSHSVGAPRWFGYPQTRLGVRTLWRSLDENSPRYDQPADGAFGSEWEIRTYLHVAM